MVLALSKKIEKDRGDVCWLKYEEREFRFIFQKITFDKWLEKRSITILFSNAEGMAKKIYCSHQQKVSTSKIQVACTDIIKMYIKRMDAVDVIDQSAAAYHFDRK